MTVKGQIKGLSKGNDYAFENAMKLLPYIKKAISGKGKIYAQVQSVS